MLGPESQGSFRLREFVLRGGVSVWFMDQPGIARCFELMEQYANHPMDLADASLVTAAEGLNIQKVFTIDRDDFSSYRIRHGRRYESFEIIG